jgi:hypothetical protein
MDKSVNRQIANARMALFRRFQPQSIQEEVYA